MITEGIRMCSLSVELLLWHRSLRLLVAPLALFRWTSHFNFGNSVISCFKVQSSAACKNGTRIGFLWVKFKLNSRGRSQLETKIEMPEDSTFAWWGPTSPCAPTRGPGYRSSSFQLLRMRQESSSDEHRRQPALMMRSSSLEQ